MPKGRKAAEDRSAFLSREQKIEVIQRQFPAMRNLLLQKAEKHAEHIKPLQELFTKAARNLKADTGVDRADWWPDFLKYMRDQNAADMNEDADRERVLSNLKLMHDALAHGEMVNFLDLIEKMPPAPEPEDEPLSESEQQLADDLQEVGEQQEAPPRAEAQEGVASPDADWGDDDDGTPGAAEDEDGSQAGFAFAAGERAGLAGNADARKILREQHPGKKTRSGWGKSFLAGHSQGLKKFHQAKSGIGASVATEPERTAAAQMETAAHANPPADLWNAQAKAVVEGGDVLPFKQPVALPATEVLASTGDVA